MLDYRPNLGFLIPAALLALLAALGAAFFFINSSGKKVSIKVFIIYTVLTLLCYLLIGLSGLVAITEPLSFYIWSQVASVVLGIVHCFCLSKLMGADEEKSFLHEFVFTLYVLVLACFTYFLTFGFFKVNPVDYVPYMTTSVFIFIMPFLIYKVFEFYIGIPAPEYPKWYFPIDKNEEELVVDEDDLADAKIFVIKFEFSEKVGADTIQTSKTKAPYRMELGEYFATFILNWNDSFPGKQIEYLDKFGQPLGWNFFVKPKWYQNPRFIDPKLSIAENDLKISDVIICERV